MVKIDITKIVDNASLLPQFSPKPTWTTRISRFPRKILFPLLILVALLQSFACWRIFIYEPQLPPRPAYNVTETVGLVTQWYELLQEMKYLGPEAIAYPPHEGEDAINMTIARHLGLSSDVIETMAQLPYINPSPGGWMPPNHDILWRNGHFVDYRNDTGIWLSRDPLLQWRHPALSSNEEDLRYAMSDFDALPPSAIPLSIIRAKGYTRYGLVLILDTASNSIIIQDTQAGGGRNADPFFEQFEWDKIPREYRIAEEIYWDKGHNARLAPDVLREFIFRTADLTEGFVPGSVRSDRQYTPELSPPQWEYWMRNLFWKAGWPDSPVFEDMSSGSGSNGTSSVDSRKKFQESKIFDEKMLDLQRNISMKYMPDRYCPVPRLKGLVETLAAEGKLTGERYKFAVSEEDVIPIDLKGWGGKLVFMQPEG